MDGQQHQIKKAAEEIGKNLSRLAEKPEGLGAGLSSSDESALASMTEEFKKLGSDYMKDSASAKQAMGLTDALVENIYGQAYRLYNTGKYKDASHLFRLLMMLDPKQSKYTLGLAACFHMLKEFKNAIEIYTICGVMDPETPIPHYHASDCYIQMKDNISALIALEMAINRSGEKPVYKTLKDRAQLTIETLKKEIMPKQL